jgi:phenylalanyl-tRNA synthetase alpha chain
MQRGHPLATLKGLIYDHFDREFHGAFRTFDELPPRVSVTQNFDELLFPADHPGRRVTDTFYFDARSLLRTHTSAHQNELLRAGHEAFLVTADCYRRDEIDSRHYPVFHQMEGVRLLPRASGSLDAAPPTAEEAVRDLKRTLEGVARALLGRSAELRWVDAYFPFTEPSLELEVMFQGAWLELLGCGAIHRDILRNTGHGDRVGWAFGIGLERLAMALFGVPDIRLFWSRDSRFLSQFRAGEITTFQPFSKFPPVYKDISMWWSTSMHENDLAQIVRSVAGDLVESLALVDTFRHPQTGRESRCYRILYRSMERTLTNEEIDELQFRIRDEIARSGLVELR